jgi:cobalt-zinc-cadmium efflux system protein
VVSVLSGSLSLIADAVHDFSDCMAPAITLVARMVSRKEADHRRIFAYRRAEAIGEVVDLLLTLVGLYVLYEAVSRYVGSQDVTGWLMVIVASIAFAVDLATVLFLYGMSDGTVNLPAGFLHKLADALASVGVIFGGVVILLKG